VYLVNNLVCSTHFGWPLLGFPPVRKDIKGGYIADTRQAQNSKNWHWGSGSCGIRERI